MRGPQTCLTGEGRLRGQAWMQGRPLQSLPLLLLLPWLLPLLRRRLELRRV